MDRNHLIKEGLNWLVHIALAILLTLVIVTYVGRFTVVKGDSMLPTLKNNSILFIEKITQRFGELRNGDIVVIKIPEYLNGEKTYAIKRIIALEGQRVMIQEGRVYVDGIEQQEEYTQGSGTTVSNSLYGDIIIPEGCIYVLGDNRLPSKSRDSRVFGPVSIDRVEGRAVFRLFPFSELGIIKK